MKMSAVGIVASFLLVANASAQVDTAWVRSWNGAANGWEQPNDIAADQFGNIYWCGSTAHLSTEIASWITAKYDSAGNVAWAKVHHSIGGLSAIARTICVGTDQSVYVAGDSPYDGGIVLIKYDVNGDEVWIRDCPGTVPWDSRLDSAGNVIVVGKQHVSGGNNDFIVMKYNPSGDLVWSRTWDRQGGWDEALQMTIAADQSVYLAGFTKEAGDNDNIAIVKYDALGTFQWFRTHDGPAALDDGVRRITTNLNGVIGVLGYSYGVGAQLDWVMLTYDPSGALLWTKRVDFDGGHDMSHDLISTANGDFVLSGEISEGGQLDGFLMRLTAEGDSVWALHTDGPEVAENAAYSIVLGSSGDLYVRTAHGALKTSGAAAVLWNWPWGEFNISGQYMVLTAPGVPAFAGIGNVDHGGASSVDVITILASECGTELSPVSSFSTSNSRPCSGEAFDLTWGRVARANTYIIQSNDSVVYEGPDTSVAVSVEEGSRSFIVTPLSLACGEGPGSDTVFVSAVSAPPAPVAPVATDQNPCPGENFIVSWLDVESATAYKLMENGVEIYEGADNHVSISHADGSYQYAVLAMNQCDTSPLSATSAPVQPRVCLCHADPQCDGATNVLDVVLTIEVAFRGGPAIVEPDPLCNPLRTDVNCDGLTGVVDVVKVVNVAFRGADAAIEYCEACP